MASNDRSFADFTTRTCSLHDSRCPREVLGASSGFIILRRGRKGTKQASSGDRKLFVSGGGGSVPFFESREFPPEDLPERV